MSSLWKTIKYLYLMGAALFILSCVYLMWIWRNGILDPATTTNVIMGHVEYLGPWGILLDIFILFFIWAFVKQSRKKKEVTGILPGLLLDLKPLPPPIPPAPPQLSAPIKDPRVEDWVWEELQMKRDK